VLSLPLVREASAIALGGIAVGVASVRGLVDCSGGLRDGKRRQTIAMIAIVGPSHKLAGVSFRAGNAFIGSCFLSPSVCRFP